MHTTTPASLPLAPITLAQQDDAAARRELAQSAQAGKIVGYVIIGVIALLILFVIAKTIRGRN